VKRVELIEFSQGVSISDVNAMKSYLHFKDETGKEFRLPVPDETVKELISIVYKETPTEKVAEAPEADEGVEEELPEGAESFGGDFDPQGKPFEEDLGPEEDLESEEDVPSI
jgi:hypothetical protein